MRWIGILPPPILLKNMPVLLGLLGVWNSTFLHINAHTVLPL